MSPILAIVQAILLAAVPSHADVSGEPVVELAPGVHRYHLKSTSVTRNELLDRTTEVVAEYDYWASLTLERAGGDTLRFVVVVDSARGGIVANTGGGLQMPDGADFHGLRIEGTIGLDGERYSVVAPTSRDSSLMQTLTAFLPPELGLAAPGAAVADTSKPDAEHRYRTVTTTAIEGDTVFDGRPAIHASTTTHVMLRESADPRWNSELTSRADHFLGRDGRWLGRRSVAEMKSFTEHPVRETPIARTLRIDAVLDLLP